MTIDDALERAREMRPHFLHVIYQLHPVDRPGSQQITADRFLRLYHDSEWLEDEEDIDMVASFILLNVEHYFRDHPRRQKGRDKIIWDVAAHLAVVSSLEFEPDVQFPAEFYRPKTFRLPEKLTAEQYYLRLKRQCDKRRKQISDAAEDAGGMIAIMAGQPLPDFGSAGGEDQKDWELDEDAPVPTVDYLIAMQNQRDMQHRNTIAGDMAGDEEIQDPNDGRRSQVNWRRQLSGVMGSLISNKAGMDDFTYTQLDHDEGMLFGTSQPGMASRQPNIAVVLDTSSSMGENRMGQSMAEIGGILRRFDTGLMVYSVDVAVHAAKEVSHRSEVRIIGRGGTDMGVGLNQAANDSPRPDVIVCITDGDTPWPEKGPVGIKVVVVNVGYRTTAPDWVDSEIRVSVQETWDDDDY